MVSVNVSQLLLSNAGAVREFDFDEPFPDPAEELRLRGPIEGFARLTRTSEGILVHATYGVPVILECARCLEEYGGDVSGVLDEEFVPSADIRSGVPLKLSAADEDVLLINEHHEIDLDEVLRQNILTNLPLRGLCSRSCPGLCVTCGQRLGPAHRTHPETDELTEQPVNPANPFAQLAVLLKDDQER